jgi:hypothetical protein
MINPQRLIQIIVAKSTFEKGRKLDLPAKTKTIVFGYSGQHR